MGAPCKFYGCKNRAVFYARKPWWAISFGADAVVNNERAHPFCDAHIRRVELRYEDKLFAHFEARGIRS